MMAWGAIALLVVVCQLTIGTDGREYCWENFNATCEDDEVVVMQAARYGRMRIGTCIRRDYLIGCDADVMPIMDKKCSGRQSCILPIPDSEMHSRVPKCPDDVLAYLEANFTCQKVAYQGSGKCVRNSPLVVNASEVKEGYISSVIAWNTGQGSGPCPWRIVVNSGQKINITLLDYDAAGYMRVGASDSGRGDAPAAAAGDAAASDPNICSIYAVVREVNIPAADITVCGGEHRKQFVFRSEGNEVEVRLITTPDHIEDMPHFLIKYQVVGCADLTAQDNGWVQRRGELVTVGCNNTMQVWHLVCDGHRWVGEIHNCSAGDSSSSQHPASGSDRSDGQSEKETLPFGLVIAIGIGVALGVVIGIIMLVAVLSCQNKFRHAKVRVPHSQGVATDGRSDMEKERMLRTGEYGYAHVWELQHLRGQGQEGDVDPKDAAAMLTNTLSHQPEFGSHLMKYPHNSPFVLSREHSYESPRFITRDLNTGEYRTGTAPIGCLHHFHADHAAGHCGIDGVPQVGVRSASASETQLPAGEEMNEARYTN